MARNKALRKTLPPASSQNGLRVEVKSPDDMKAAIARVAVESALGNATLISTAQHCAGAPAISKLLELQELVEVLRDRTKATQNGSLASAEAMLINQATALESLFTCLASRAMRHDVIPGFEVNMRMALRAQNQCRSTLETLAAIKNPPVVFAKQANISHGHQQINNGESAPIARAEKIEKPQTELLEHDNGKRMDNGTATATSRSNPPMETVATIHRPAQRRRKGGDKP